MDPSIWRLVLCFLRKNVLLMMMHPARHPSELWAPFISQRFFFFRLGKPTPVFLYTTIKFSVSPSLGKIPAAKRTPANSKCRITCHLTCLVRDVSLIFLFNFFSNSFSSLISFKTTSNAFSRLKLSYDVWKYTSRSKRIRSSFC